ncbi:hypothetical protein FH972_023386 [Carpinus fangiana]|uniref:Bromo domain-containing protein n=1 Tax=Carpinus fangiana TaxID=176857 RepID=A0A5N6KVA4_9ROSI|nr:hypothetical protein FH972_023386 [Carpinus fangiana]
MTVVANFTPLQTLLLFQSLSVHGTDRRSFEKASESLRRSNDAGDGSNEDAPGSPTDVTPESLQELYLTLLKDEAKKHLQESLDRDEKARNGDAPPSSPRKRKIRSPVMPTIEEAKQHAHLIPRMIPRLYASYKARAIEDIRSEERRYDSLVKELRDAQQQDLASAATPSASDTTKSNELPSAADKASIDAIINHTPLVSPRPNGQVALPQESSLPPPGRTLPSQPEFVQAPPLIPPSRTAAHRHEPHNATFQPSSLPPFPQGKQSPLPAGTRLSSGAQSTPSGPPPFPPNSPYNQAGANAQSINAQSASYPTRKPPMADSFPPGGPHSNDTDHVSGPPYPHAYPSQVPPGSYAHPPYPQSGTPSLAYTAPQHRGGYMLPPFQVSPQAPSSAHQNQPPKPHPGTAPPRTAVKGSDVLRVRTSDVGTPSRQTGVASPVSGPRHSHLRREGLKYSPGSTTAWRDLPLPSTPGFASRPQSRSISPLSDKEDDVKATLRPGNALKAKPGPRAIGRARQARGVSKTPSTAATSARGRTRSHSVVSHGDMSVGDDGNSVKNEVATPASFKQEVDTDDARSTRQSRRGAPTKRKRANTATTDEQMASPGPAAAAVIFVDEAPPDTVVAVRNFAKVSAPILENIRRHKHASIFENPVKERDAEGYKDIIRRPQDFKSIRLAITAGTKAVATALESLGEDGEGNTVTLPLSEDLVPPKAIVNAAQLEQEIMRMLANAVMFNPGDDEIVEDTREMFGEAEQLLRQWRASERVAAEEEEVGPATPAEEEQGSKRRRLRAGEEDP